MYKYPYQNSFLIDMPGEVWKPVPDFENYYMVSNMGRIRSLEREVSLNFNPLRSHALPEKILCQDLQVNKNVNTLRVQFSVDNVRVSVMTKNLVYTVFVEPVNLNNYEIINIDGAGENCRAENLKKRLRRKKDRKAQELREKRLKEGWSDSCPYQNLSLENMPDEIWKPLVGYEKYYMVSNLGRVKSLARKTERILKDKKVNYEVKETVRKQVLDTRNTLKLSFAVNIDKKRREYQTSYAVYSSFIKPFNIKKYKITYRDKNTLNNRVENLILTER